MTIQNGIVNGMQKEIRGLHYLVNQADMERDEAVAYAQQLKDELQEYMQRYKKDVESLEHYAANMKEQRDLLARVNQLQLEISE